MLKIIDKTNRFNLKHICFILQQHLILIKLFQKINKNFLVQKARAYGCECIR